MSSDPARQYIDDVKDALEALFPGSPPFKVGALKFAENDAPPIVKWKFGGIEHEPSTVVGTIGTEIQELIVRIWNKGDDPDESDANTRTLKNRVMLACRQVAQRTQIVDPIAFGSFEWNTEAHQNFGRFLEGSILVKFGMPNVVKPKALITKTQITQAADYDGDGVADETIHTTADFTDDGAGNPEVVP